MSDEQPDLRFIARQLRRVITDAGQLKDDMGVMMAILRRLDGAVAGLVNEVRAMRAHPARAIG